MHKHDRLSYLLHAEALKMLNADPSLIDRALGILDQWERLPANGKAKPFYDEWRRILQERDWTPVLEDTERANHLRQHSPLACLLPKERRLEIIRTKKEFEDEPLRNAKRKIQQESWEAIRSGQLKQSDLFLIRPELARKVTLKFKK